MLNFLNPITKALAAIGLGVASFLGLWSEPNIDRPIDGPKTSVVFVREHETPPPPPIPKQELQLGNSTLPIAGTTYYLSGAGVSSSAASITLTSFKIPQSGQKIQDSDLSDTFYITLEPGNTTRQEIVSCTTVTQNAAGTATLSGCSRGLSPITPYTASTTLSFAHAGGTQVIFSNPPQLYNKTIIIDNSATSTGKHVWSSTTPPGYDLAPTNHLTGTAVATTSEFASLAYVNAVSAAGCADAATGNQGCVEIATPTEQASSTASGSEALLVLAASNATSSPYTHSGSGNTYAVITEDDGYIAEGFIDYSQNITRTGTVTNSATTTLEKTRVGTTSTTEVGLAVGTTTYFSKGVGIGVSTTTETANLQVSGNTILGVATATTIYVDTCYGCLNYTGSSTAFNGSSFTFSTAIPSDAKFGIGDWAITDCSKVHTQGSIFIAETGATIIRVGTRDYNASTACDGAYTFTWSAVTQLAIVEDTDSDSDSTIEGTIYWYR